MCRMPPPPGPSTIGSRPVTPPRPPPENHPAVTSAPLTPTRTSDDKQRHVRSLYDLRVQLVQNALRDHSKLGDKTSFDLAVHVLDALDHLPEQRAHPSTVRKDLMVDIGQSTSFQPDNAGPIALTFA